MRPIASLVCIMLGIAALLALGMWASSTGRAVDGRSASQWLALVEQASHTVSYHAMGTTSLGRQTAHFLLDQGREGCYTCRTIDAAGKRCTMGYDGCRMWYANDQHAAEAVSDKQTTTIPDHVVSRILGSGQLAGRPVVRLSLQSGTARKEITVDRQTGVILAMKTQLAHGQHSEMRVEKISYRDVAVQPCSVPADAAIYPVTPQQASEILGQQAPLPTWLPEGMTLAKMYHRYCCCNPRGMVVVRYSDGVTTLTLFETSGCNCDMGSGCLQAPSADALVETRTIGKVKVTAIGELEAETLHKVLESLR